MLTTTARSIAAAAIIGLSALGLVPTANAAGSVDKQCPGGVLDDCYSKSEMPQFLDVAVGLVEKYFDQFSRQGRPIPHPAAIVYIPTGEIAPTACLDGALDDQAYAYCPLDNRIYIGQELLWLLYDNLGAVSPVAGLAHEYGHYLQDFVGVPEPQTNDETVRHENQADCIAGAWTDFTNEDGALEYQKDLTNIGEFLVTIGSMEGPGRDHGTPEERQASFLLGFAGELVACNFFYLVTPLTA